MNINVSIIIRPPNSPKGGGQIKKPFGEVTDSICQIQQVQTDTGIFLQGMAVTHSLEEMGVVPLFPGYPFSWCFTGKPAGHHPFLGVP